MRLILAAFAALAISAATVSAACDDGDDGEAPTGTPPAAPSSATPEAVPTTPPDPPGEVVEFGYTTEQVLPEVRFDRMLAMVPIPGDGSHVAIVTQDGFIYRADLADDGSEPQLYLDVSSLIIPNPGDEEGLLGLGFAPDFEATRELYIYYSAGGPRRTVLARYRAPGDAADPASAQVLLEVEQPYPNHNGGALSFGPDGYLYVGLGDGGAGANGQSTGVLLGKILRLDISGEGYTSPPDNPFAAGGGRAEIWAYGLRNPWRISFDSATGVLWAGDVGQGEWEEIDRIERGGNYGWNILEGPDCYNASDCDLSGKIEPRAAYTHDDGCSVTGGYVYRGAAIPELGGWYVYADYCFGRVWAFDAASPGGEAVTLMDSGKTISSFGQDPAGELYLVTFDQAIYRIVRQ
ncbi:MAG: PQQ-dependent sugar dehydrogenase [Dehalococcoidia bacterium]